MAGKKNNNSKPKGDSKSAGDGDKGGGKLKGGQKIEVRHILVSLGLSEKCKTNSNNVEDGSVQKALEERRGSGRDSTSHQG